MKCRKKANKLSPGIKKSFVIVKVVTKDAVVVGMQNPSDNFILFIKTAKKIVNINLVILKNNVINFFMSLYIKKIR
jgi:hypothetical protein